MKRTLLLINFMLCSIFCMSQNTPEDSLDSDFNTWALRAGIGIQKSPYFEIGLSRLMIFADELDFSSAAFYVSTEINRRQKFDDPFYYGFKGGIESSWSIWMFAIEAKYLSDFKREKTFLITPKIGLSLFGILNLLYGYNFPKDLNSFPGIANHQFSLIFHLSPKLIKAF